MNGHVSEWVDACMHTCIDGGMGIYVDGCTDE